MTGPGDGLLGKELSGRHGRNLGAAGDSNLRGVRAHQHFPTLTCARFAHQQMLVFVMLVSACMLKGEAGLGLRASIIAVPTIADRAQVLRATVSGLPPGILPCPVECTIQRADTIPNGGLICNGTADSHGDVSIVVDGLPGEWSALSICVTLDLSQFESYKDSIGYGGRAFVFTPPLGESIDCGVICMSRYFYADCIRAASDEELLAELDENVRLEENGIWSRMVPCGGIEQRESVLSELVRRGPRLGDAVGSRLASIRSAGQTPYGLHAMQLLRDLARVNEILSGRLDPLHLEWHPSARTFTFPDPITIDITLQCSACMVCGSESAVPALGSPEESLWVQACDQGGGGSPRIRHAHRHGWAFRPWLEPESPLMVSVNLWDYVLFPQAGEYDVSLMYHCDDALSERGQIGDRLVAKSKTRSIRVLPRVMHISVEDAELAEACCYDIANGGEIALAATNWNPNLDYERAPGSLEEILFRLGWSTVPTIVRVLASSGLDPAAKGRLLAMLWNLTGIWVLDVDDMGCALGEYFWVGSYCGVKAKEAYEPVRGERHYAVIDIPVQERAIARWQRLAQLIILE